MSRASERAAGQPAVPVNHPVAEGCVPPALRNGAGICGAKRKASEGDADSRFEDTGTAGSDEEEEEDEDDDEYDPRASRA